MTDKPVAKGMVDISDLMLSSKTRANKARKAKAKHTGWTKGSPAHAASGSPILPEVIHSVYLDLLNYDIENVYLSRNIYPGARAYIPHLGKGTVLYCRLQKPYIFAFLPDSEFAIKEGGTLQLKHFDPLNLSPNWCFPDKSLKNWEPLEYDEDEDILTLSGDQRKELSDLCVHASPWQLGEAIQFLVDELRKKVK